jgi:hypothetical protein
VRITSGFGNTKYYQISYVWFNNFNINIYYSGVMWMWYFENKSTFVFYRLRTHTVKVNKITEY